MISIEENSIVSDKRLKKGGLCLQKRRTEGLLMIEREVGEATN